MPSISEREKDPLKKHWWVIGVVCAFVGAWIYLPFNSGTGSDAVEIDKSASQTEQSLFSLDSAENPQGAPGSSLAIPVDGARGPYARKAEGQVRSGLYQSAAGASGEPVVEGAKQDALAKGSAAQGLDSLSPSKPKTEDGWGGQEARTGFSKPQAKFEPAGSSRGGGTGSSSAQFVNQKPFGTGGDPGLDLRTGPSLQSAASRLRENVANSQTVQGLRGAQKTSLAALKGNDELSVGMSGKSFDAAGGAKSSMGALESAAGGGGTGLDSGQDVPMNLKGNDPNVNQKLLEPPSIDKSGEVKDDSNKEYMQQQMLMMLMGVAISGILGPTFSGIGMALAGGMGLNQPSQGSMDKVDTPKAKTGT